MHQKFVGRLSDEERGVCQEIIKQRKGSAQQFRRAQILLKTDAAGPAWCDVRIAEAFNCRVHTLAHRRKRLVREGCEGALDGKKRQAPPTPCTLAGEAEAPLIALRLGKPPSGDGPWTLPRLADVMGRLAIVDAISDATVRKVRKKTACRSGRLSTG